MTVLLGQSLQNLAACVSCSCWLQELRQRIRDSYEARWKAEKHFDEDQILNEMPGSLRIEVCLLPVMSLCTYNPSCTLS